VISAIAVVARNRIACDITVGEVVYSPALTCRVENNIHEALETMRREQVRRLPVVNSEGALVGLLSMDDLTRQARHQDDTYHPPISYEDVVNTVQGIYLPSSQSSNQMEAAA
jgi:CBS domain-containing protein